MQLLKNKSSHLEKLCLLKLIYDYILLQPDMKCFNVSILQSLFLPQSQMKQKIGETFDPSITRILGKVSNSVL